MDWGSLPPLVRLFYCLLAGIGIAGFIGIVWLVAQIGNKVFEANEAKKLDGEEVKHFDKFV